MTACLAELWNRQIVVMNFTLKLQLGVESPGCPFSREASYSLRCTSLLDLRSAGRASMRAWAQVQRTFYNFFKAACVSVLIGPSRSSIYRTDVLVMVQVWVAVSPSTIRYGPARAACQKEVFHSVGDDVGGFLLGDEVGRGNSPSPAHPNTSRAWMIT